MTVNNDTQRVTIKQQPELDAKRITIQRAAELLGVHPNTIRNLIARKQLKAERIGARIVRVQEQDVQALLTPYVGGEFGVWK
jgi:excisionase family DNA binding protein